MASTEFAARERKEQMIQCFPFASLPEAVHDRIAAVSPSPPDLPRRARC